MDVVLIQPKQKLSKNFTRGKILAPLPAGLLSVATPLDLAGYKIRIIDQRLDDKWEEHLLAELKTRPICVGITAMTGPQIWWALKASALVKRNSGIPVVWGGVHASLLPEQTLQNPNIDIVVKDEGEETFFELVKALENKQPLENVKGIYFKNGGVIKQNPPRAFIDLNQLPFLSYHLVNIKNHLTKINGRDCFMIETSRGCPYSCGFCYNTCFHQKHWRALAAERVLENINYIMEKFGITGIGFRDDNFFTDPDRAYRILNGIVQQKLDLVWGKGDIRLDLLGKLDDDYLQLIARSNCLNLVIGVESGSQDMVDLMRKEIDVSQAFPVNQRLRDYPFSLYYLFLMGIPGETENDLIKTSSMILKLVKENNRATVGTQIFIPYPGTELFNLAVQNALKVPQKLEDWISAGWANRDINYPWLSPGKRKLMQMIQFCSFFISQGNSLKTWTEVSPWVLSVSRVYSPVAHMRMKRSYSRFFPELTIAKVLGYKGY